MTDTGRDLYLALCASPEDDTLRLALADWLQENGDEDRAELIRMQVELAALGWPPLNTSRMFQLEQRMYELVTAHPEWRSIPCPECESKGTEPGLWGWRRCHACDDTGDLALRRGEDSDSPIPTRRSHERRADSWVRGWWVPCCTLQELATEMDGKATPTPWARALARSVPVASLWLVGVLPIKNSSFESGTSFDWFDGGSVSHSEGAALPKFLFREVATMGRSQLPTDCYTEFPDPTAALDALSAAAARWLVRKVWG